MAEASLARVRSKPPNRVDLRAMLTDVHSKIRDEYVALQCAHVVLDDADSTEDREKLSWGTCLLHRSLARLDDLIDELDRCQLEAGKLEVTHA